ncbi:MAG: thioredoxin family protein [Nitrospinota bacterium]
MATVRTIATSEFDRDVLNANSPVLVDFCTDWCGSCRAMDPVVEALSKKADGRFQVVKVNVEKDRDLAIRYEIRSVPTFLIFKNGEIVFHHAGLPTGGRLASALEDTVRFAAG